MDDKIKAMFTDVPAPIIAALEAFEEKRAAIEGQPFLPTAKAERIAELARDTRTQIARLTEAAATEAETVFDQREGEARLAGRVAPVTFSGHITHDDLLKESIRQTSQARQRAELQAQIATLADDPAGLALTVENALLSEDVLTIRTLGALALRRLAALADADLRARVKKGSAEAGAVSPVQLLHGQAADAMRVWLAAHPTPAERVSAVKQQRGSRAFMIQHRVNQLVEHLMRGARAAAAAPTSTSTDNMVVGPAFERRKTA